jgi:hypothetical protein
VVVHPLAFDLPPQEKGHAHQHVVDLIE